MPNKFDGKFHKLEVKLTRSKGTVRARRGYCAIKNGPNAQDGTAPGLEPELGNKEDGPRDLKRVMASREELRELPIDVSTEVMSSSGDTKDLNVVVRLDIGSVPFRKEGDRNINIITFVAGIYDSEGKWVSGQQKRFDLPLPDSQLKDMRANGVGVKNTFQLKPGRYLLREVVQDSEDQHLAAINQSIEIP